MTFDHSTEQRRTFAWAGLSDWRAEVSTVYLMGSGLSARGTQLGSSPFPYRLEYTLEAVDNWVTRRLFVTVDTPTSRRSVDLTHDGAGSWRCEARIEGTDDLAPPGGDPTYVEGALDCDLGFSPLTNVMPVRRAYLHTRPGGRDFVMAWMSVPDLRLVRSEQRYEHVSANETQTVVRYVGRHRDFTGNLILDTDGFVILYPDMAKRVAASGPLHSGDASQADS